MLVEDQRYIHEDLERLEQGIAERIAEEPKHIRDRLNRDHEVSQLLEQIQKQSEELLTLYQDASGQRLKEVQQISSGDPFDEFYRQVGEIREHHARYPNEQAENSELRYRHNKAGEDGGMPYIVDSLFSGEEAFGRFFDLSSCHESYLNLPNVKRLPYLVYLQVFDDFTPGAGGLKRSDKISDQYVKYLGELIAYLESFMQRTRPLENLEKVFAGWAQDFETAWEKDEVPGWQTETAGAKNGPSKALSSPDAVWCNACEKEFKNENTYKGHLPGKKHVKAAKELAERQGASQSANGVPTAHRLKERAIADREFKVKKLAAAMSTEREDTKVNVERRQGMTDRERAQELENLFTQTAASEQAGNQEEGDEDEGEERIYNPLKLPLAWDGKPIPFWLYRLHGLGVEFPCEICGNWIYRGRRAFDKHFNESRHIHGLKCLGVTNTHLFRDITDIQEALRLWDKMQRDDRQSKVDDGSVVQMEDAEGNVMPEKVYYDLQKQGLL
ncbi:splicing factor 3A subunit 3 [Thozetella sp. PMI_491]|nr:splicing factor 3A subunit 3 [Thozetella sp. PMI_491]